MGPIYARLRLDVHVHVPSRSPQEQRYRSLTSFSSFPVLCLFLSNSLGDALLLSYTILGDNPRRLICFQFSFSLLFLLIFLFFRSLHKRHTMFPPMTFTILHLHCILCAALADTDLVPFFWSLKELKALIRNRRFLRQQNLSFISYILPPSTKKYALEHKHINP
jgi:hypothetical protein